MLYLSISVILNLALAVLVGRIWLSCRDQKSDAERVAREFELMLQAEQAEQRTELLQAHALLMQANQRVRELEAVIEGRADPRLIMASPRPIGTG